MSWRKFMLRKLFGIKDEDKQQKHYEIEPVMVNPDVVRMDMKSFRESRVVKEQIAAAKRNYSAEAETA